ncbi:MAG: Ig-like domain repeat protein, partial [Brevundimonas sp.]|nr:Ig-like domain repeat protein [Pseudomonadota bacterium]
DIDGKAVNKPTIEQSDILSGDHTITFGMAATPQAWGSGHTTAQKRTPYVDAAKPDYGTVATTDDTDLSLLVDDNSRTSVKLPAEKSAVTWTSTSGSVAVASYTLTNGASGAAPQEWTLEGSNDGESWTVLDHRADQSFAWATQTRAFSVAEPSLFTRYRLSIASTSTGQPATLAELELLDDTVQQSTDLELFPAAKLTALTGTQVSSVLATVKGGTNVLADYSATVDFLDGAGAQPATVKRSALGGAQVTAPHTFADAGLYTVRVTVTAVVDGQPATVTGLTTIAVRRDATLLAAFDNACLTVPGTAVDCDGNGWGYDKTKLGAAFKQGTTIAVGTAGLSFDLPAVASGKPDNATARGQRIRVDLGVGAKNISLVGFATESTRSGTATLEYSDGSTQDLPVTFGDWVGAASTPVGGNTVVATMTGRLQGTSGSDSLKTGIFATAPVALKSGVTAEWLTLPLSANTIKQGQLHFFGVASDGARTPVPALEATGLHVDDQVAGRAEALDLATVTGGQPTGAGYSATISWGDQTPVEKVAVGAKVVTGEHAFAAPGTYTVTVVVDDGVTSTSTTTTVTVDTSVYETVLSATPHQVAPGQAVTVAGSGFAKNEQVVVELASTPKVTRTVTSSATGTFSTSVTVPGASLDGRYPITALGARSNTVAETSVDVVRPLVDTKVSVAASPATATVGKPVTLTASLAPVGTGAVEFFDGRTSLGLVSVAAGKAALVVDDLAPGSHAIRAAYAGDAGHKPATSATITVTVTKVAVSLGAPRLSRTSKVYGAATAVTVATTVKGATSGTVTFKNGSTVLGRAVIGRSGTGYGASLLLARGLPAGTYAKIT